MYLQGHSSTVLPPPLSLQNCQISLSFCPLSPSSFIRALFIQHITVCRPSFSLQNYISGKALRFLYHGYDWTFSIGAKQNVGSSSLLQSFIYCLLQKQTKLGVGGFLQVVVFYRSKMGCGKNINHIIVLYGFIMVYRCRIFI